MERFCSECGDDTFFEVPPCLDGHGEDCLDLMCVDCGSGVTSFGQLLADDVVLAQAA